jgi:hypothetical protein
VVRGGRALGLERKRCCWHPRRPRGLRTLGRRPDRCCLRYPPW